MSDAPEGLAAPEQCEQCKAWVETAAGMDSYVEITDYDTTKRDKYVFCEWSCVGEWFEDGRALGLIPGVLSGTDCTVSPGGE
jgi:hypothetical protein